MQRHTYSRELLYVPADLLARSNTFSDVFGECGAEERNVDARDNEVRGALR